MKIITEMLEKALTLAEKDYLGDSIDDLKQAMLEYGNYQHNNAIADVISKLGDRVEFGHLEGYWKYIREDLEELKKPI